MGNILGIVLIDVHTVSDKTVRSGAWLIFVKAVFD